MAKSLVLGNGSVLVGLDEFAQIKDFYYDYVGLENHLTEEAVCRLGVWVDGAFSWLSDGSWRIATNYQKETLASNITAENENLEVKLSFVDVVYNEKNIFIRNITVENLALPQVVGGTRETVGVSKAQHKLRGFFD